MRVLEGTLRGLSPPTRGNLTKRLEQILRRRSIPAHAGEPCSQRSADGIAAGLSPPTRGNPAMRRRRRHPRGSIPAHAGEPIRRIPKRGRRRVYPRPRGGTTRRSISSRRIVGLSPPTRGNLRFYSYLNFFQWSIPAHAGEPTQPSMSARRRGVYPRPRGGTTFKWYSRHRVWGLSPPTRGNRLDQRQRLSCARSIPAHAGEPDSPRIGGGWRRVYPRPRGGTFGAGGVFHPDLGLSPPTRGNPSSAKPPLTGVRSIPAHAGEPTPLRKVATAWEVYPRPRGGTWA